MTGETLFHFVRIYFYSKDHHRFFLKLKREYLRRLFWMNKLFVLAKKILWISFA